VQFGVEHDVLEYAFVFVCESLEERRRWLQALQHSAALAPAQGQCVCVCVCVCARARARAAFLLFYAACVDVGYAAGLLACVARVVWFAQVTEGAPVLSTSRLSLSLSLPLSHTHTHANTHTHTHIHIHTHTHLHDADCVQ
jgi:hypothetical protein